MPGNQLCRLWELAFQDVGRERPYYLAEDVEAVLSDLDISFVKEEVQSLLCFPDTAANRDCCYLWGA